MKQFCFIALSIVATVGLFFAIYDTNKEHLEAQMQTQCLRFPTPGQTFLCAQCIQRPKNISSTKPLVVMSSAEYTFLQIPQAETYLSCKQFVQFVDYSKKTVGPVSFQKQRSIPEIIKELNADIAVDSTGKFAVDSNYNKLVIYRMFNIAQSKVVKVIYANPEYVKAIQHFFVYILNAVLALTFIAWLCDSTFMNNLSRPVKYQLLGLLIVLELITFNLGDAQITLCLARIILMNVGLLRVSITKKLVLAYFVCGIVLYFFPVSLIAYYFIGWLLITIQGYDKLNLRPIWRYIFTAYLLLTINYAVWFFLFRQTADTGCRIVELAFLIMIPCAFLMLQDVKVYSFQEYHPSDPETNSISIRGYEEEQF